jgi:chromosome segregation ATPase
LSLLFRLLQLMPAVRQLEEERNVLRSEQNSIKLKLRAASAEMGVLEEQCRVLQGERDRLVKEVAQQKTEHEEQAARLKAALAAREALTGERDTLLQEHRALLAQNEAGRTERQQTQQTANILNNRRKKTGPG